MKNNLIKKLALIIIPILCSYTHPQEFDITLQSAKLGDANAQNNIGVCYEYGIGVKKNQYKAFDWYLKSAKQGVANAQNAVGAHYYKGEGVNTNYRKAKRWYLKSAKQGDANAQFNLGLCYYYGNGVIKSNKIARKWMTKAAEQRHKESINFINETLDISPRDNNIIAKID